MTKIYALSKKACVLKNSDKNTPQNLPISIEIAVNRKYDGLKKSVDGLYEQI
jgi:hypothetical protein